MWGHTRRYHVFAEAVGHTDGCVTRQTLPARWNGCGSDTRSSEGHVQSDLQFGVGNFSLSVMIPFAGADE